MKKIILPALMAVMVASFTACSKPEDRNMTNADAQTNSNLNTSPSSPDMQDQNSMNSDMANNNSSAPRSSWAGEYEGTFPCADCEGIKVKLQLNPDKTYELNEEYLGKGANNEFETKGSFSIDPQQPSMIILDNKAENRKFFLGENFLEARDIETGKKIESNLNYKLLKKSP
jgi:uncharacterized lipoprotein NlpE involved in copper resistance